MAIECPFMDARERTVGKVRYRSSAADRRPGPITRPAFVTDPDREFRINAALADVNAAYDQYQLALAKFKAIGGAMPDPGVDPAQMRFAFADAYVTQHIEIVQPRPAMYGPNSSRVEMLYTQTHAAINSINPQTPPECRACLIRLVPPAPPRASKPKSADKRMAEIFEEIYNGADPAGD